MDSRLVMHWERAARDLQIEVIAPFLADLPCGSSIRAEVLVIQFGAIKGMLIIEEYSRIEPHVSQLRKAGYGFSVMREPRIGQPYALEDFVDVLCDWGWTGPVERTPEWVRTELAEEGEGEA